MFKTKLREMIGFGVIIIEYLFLKSLTYVSDFFYGKEDLKWLMI